MATHSPLQWVSQLPWPAPRLQQQRIAVPHLHKFLSTQGGVLAGGHGVQAGISVPVMSLLVSGPHTAPHGPAHASQCPMFGPSIAPMGGGQPLLCPSCCLLRAPAGRNRQRGSLLECLEELSRAAPGATELTPLESKVLGALET